LRLQQDPRFDIVIEMVKDRRPVEHARNLCIVTARAFNADVCIQVDNDMTLPGDFADIVYEALAFGKHVVSLPSGCLLPEGPAMIPGDNGPADGQFRECGRGGSGVLVIGAEVWRKIPRGPWFRWVTNDDEVLSRALSEDYYFCQLVQEHGLTVWTHQHVAGHLKTTDATAWTLRLVRLQNKVTLSEGGILPLEALNPPVFVEG
jgi:hypothetical protein